MPDDQADDKGLDQQGASEKAVATSDPLWPSVVRFVVPTYALVVTNMILTALDKGFIGQISSLQLAALGPATAVFDCTSYLLTFLNTATLSMLGNRPEAELNKIRSHALVFTTVSGLLQGALLLCVAARSVRLLGASGAMVPFSLIYLQLRAFGAPVDRLGSVSTQLYLAKKDGVTPMLGTLIAAVFNAGGDFLLCPRYGVAGAAVATVLASAVSAGFLVWRLRLRRLWPQPFEMPSLKDFLPFASFAGPIFLVLLMKVILFAMMTAGATSMGTAPAAAHQVLVSVFFVSGIAFGQPLSWAAQSFLPGAKDRRRMSRALLAVASGFVALGGTVAWLMTRYCLGWFTRDTLVRTHAEVAAPAVVLFVILYAGFLTLEGFAIAIQQIRVCLAVSFTLATAGGLSIWALQARGLLTLTNLWASQATLLGAGAAILGAATWLQVRRATSR